jgi:hypothetical protein
VVEFLLGLGLWEMGKSGMKERATIDGNARRMRNKIIGLEVYGKITFKSIMPVLGGCSIKHDLRVQA